MRLFGTLLLAAAVLPSTLAQATSVKPPSLRDRQQAACYSDVTRLCKDAMPDVDKVTACMKSKKSEVSPKCAAMWNVKH